MLKSQATVGEAKAQFVAAGCAADPSKAGCDKLKATVNSAGRDLAKVLDGGFKGSALRFPAKILNSAGRDLAKVLDGGFKGSALRFPAKVLKGAGYSAADMYDMGDICRPAEGDFCTPSGAGVGYSVSELIEGGFTLKALAQGGIIGNVTHQSMQAAVCA